MGESTELEVGIPIIIGFTLRAWLGVQVWVKNCLGNEVTDFRLVFSAECDPAALQALIPPSLQPKVLCAKVTLGAELEEPDLPVATVWCGNSGIHDIWLGIPTEEAWEDFEGMIRAST